LKGFAWFLELHQFNAMNQEMQSKSTRGSTDGAAEKKGTSLFAYICYANEDAHLSDRYHQVINMSKCTSLNINCVEDLKSSNQTPDLDV
jgi:hypothetical protein